MPTKQKHQTPSYLLHKPTGQARVRINGHDHYLGQYGSPESRERYDDLVAEWFARNSADGYRLTIDELAILFVQHADRYYRRKDGTPTGETANIRSTLMHLVAHFGPTRVRDFGPLELKQFRQLLIKAGHSRSGINADEGPFASGYAAAYPAVHGEASGRDRAGIRRGRRLRRLRVGT